MSDLDSITAVVGQMVEALSTFTSDALIIEDLAPYRWQGPGSVQAWLTAMATNAQKLGIKSIHMELGASIREDVTGSRAYSVHAGRLSYSAEQCELVADGQLTLTLIRQPDRWLIESLIWTGPAPAPQ
jgi:hypothetical protein